MSDGIPQEWLEEFEAAARRPLKDRLNYSFVKTYRPVMDDAEFRSFDTMEDYRRWCEENLPRWLGYSRAEDDFSAAQFDSKEMPRELPPRRKRARPE